MSARILTVLILVLLFVCSSFAMAASVQNFTPSYDIISYPSAKDLTWVNILAEEGTGSSTTSTTTVSTQATTASNQFSQVRRYTATFNTTNNTHIPTGVKLYIYGAGKSNNLGAPAGIVVVNSSMTVPPVDPTDVFNKTGHVVLSNAIVNTSYNSDGWNTLTFNTAGINAVNTSGNTSISVVLLWDADQTFNGTWLASQTTVFGFNTSAKANPPLLEVSWESAIPQVSFTANVTSGVPTTAVLFTNTSGIFGSPTYNWTLRNWTFGNIETQFSSAKDPTTVFGYGNHSIRLNITNASMTNITPDGVFWVNVTGAGSINQTKAYALASTVPLSPSDSFWKAPVTTLPRMSVTDTYIATYGAGTVHYVYKVFKINTVNSSTLKQNFSIITHPEVSNVVTVPIPDNAYVSTSSGDDNLMIMDLDAAQTYETYDTQRLDNGTWKTYVLKRYNLTSNALTPDGYWTADAAGTQVLPGVIRYDEVANGTVDHAIRAAFPTTGKDHVWPARADGSQSNVSYPPMGQRFRLNASFDASGMNTTSQAIVLALKTYGMIIADNSGTANIVLGADNDPRWGPELWTEWSTIGPTLSDYDAVDATVFMIDSDSGQALPLAAPDVHTGLSNTTGSTSVTMSFTNPTTPVAGHFNHTLAYWNNTWIGNLSNTTTSYVATGLAPATPQTFSTRSCSVYGVCNSTFVNLTMTTDDLPPPVSDFSGDPVIGTEPTTVTFTDASTGIPTSWKWAYKNATQNWVVFPTNSTEQNPITTFPAGVYDINLTATNAGGSDDEVKVSYLVFYPPAPVAAFSGNNTSLCMGDYVKFTDASTNYPDSWYWEYGDGNTSTTQSPTFQYNVAGTFNVNLWANNTGGGDWENKSSYVSVVDCAIPDADFTVSDTTICGGDTVTFTDTSTKSPSSWAWNFGDSNTSALQNPSHTYDVLGSMTVALQATNAFGSDTETKVAYITVTDCVNPIADFTVNDTALCVGDYAKFTDTSQHVPTSWIWTFGDGNTSILQNPEFQYNVIGSQTVSLHATNAYGFDMETKAGLVTVSSCAAPVASFTSSITSACTGDWVTFADTSTGTPTSWYWVFGTEGTSTVQNPAFQFSATGDHFVNLSATNAFGTDWENKTAYMHLSDCSGIPVSGGTLKNVSAGMTVTCKGPYPHLVSLGIENFLPASQTAIYYNWISVLILMSIGIMASSRTTRFFAILLPVVAALLMYFGWFTYNDPSNPGRLMGVVIMGIVLAVAIYMKGALHERFGIAGPGSLFFNIVFYIILLQATVGFVNSTNLWGGVNAAMTPTNEFSNIDIRAEVTNVSQAGGALGEIAGMGSIILEMTLGIIRMFISMGVALAAFGVVIGAIYPWIPSNTMGAGLLVLMQLGIYIIYYMAFMRFIYKPSGEGDF